MLRGSEMRPVHNSVDTVNAAAAAIVSAGSRTQSTVEPYCQPAWLLGGMLSTRPRHLRVDLPARASSDSKAAVRAAPAFPRHPAPRLLHVPLLPSASSHSNTAGIPPLPPPPPHRAHRVPPVFTRILNHRIEPSSTPAKSDSQAQAQFVCTCFGGAFEVSLFSENTMTSLRKKLSKMLRRYLCCTDCSAHVTCFGKHVDNLHIDNHAVVNYYYGKEGETRDDGRQGGGSHGGGSQQAVPDLISL